MEFCGEICSSSPLRSESHYTGRTGHNAMPLQCGDAWRRSKNTHHFFDTRIFHDSRHGDSDKNQDYHVSLPHCDCLHDYHENQHCFDSLRQRSHFSPFSLLLVEVVDAVQSLERTVAPNPFDLSSTQPLLQVK